MRRRPLTVVLAVALAAAAGVPAVAAWLVTSNPSTNAVSAASLSDLTPTASPLGSTSINVAWVPGSGQPASAVYSVERTLPSSFAVCTNVTQTSCSDTGLTPNTTYAYTVTSRITGSNWTKTTPAVSGRTTVAAATLDLTGPTGTVTTASTNVVGTTTDTATVTIVTRNDLNVQVDSGPATLSGSGPTYTISRTVTGLVTGRTYTSTATQTNAGGTSTDSVTYTAQIDTVAPTVTSLVRAGGAAAPTRASTVSWTATFSEAVTGVDSTDFALAGSAGTLTGASIGTVTGSGTTWTIPVTTGGDGNLGLNLVDNDSIVDTATPPNPLNGPGTGAVGNGSATGDTYAVDKTAPVVASVGVGPQTSVGATGYIGAGKLAYVYATVTDAVGVATVTANLSSLGGASAQSMSLQSGTGTNGVWRGQFTTGAAPPLSNGTSYSITVTAADVATSTSAPTSGTVRVDTVLPINVAVTSPANNATVAGQTSASLSGTLGTVAASTTTSADGQTIVVTVVEVRTNGTTPAAGTISTPVVNGGSWSASVTALTKNRNYRVTVSQTDGAGNTTTSTAVNFSTPN